MGSEKAKSVSPRYLEDEVVRRQMLTKVHLSAKKEDLMQSTRLEATLLLLNSASTQILEIPHSTGCPVSEQQ